ncbi:MAG: ABC transporter ATP-binding protein [Bacteroidales bacterium]
MGIIQNTNNQAFITVLHLKKQFDDVAAVNDISFNVNKGELFGFLGPNGAGKTTTINMLTGLARPDKGKITIAGHECSINPKAAQHLIGVVPDESNLYPELTGYDNLCFCASLYGIHKNERQVRAKNLLADFGLKEAANRKFSGYSKGMKRKLTIAAGIIHNPPILFLDEPTTGIDVASARQIRNLIRKLHNDGTTIFLTTHYIEEAERLCERIAFIVNGKIVENQTVNNLLEPVKDKKVMRLEIEGGEEKLTSKLKEKFPDYEFNQTNARYITVESEKPINIGPLVRYIEDCGIWIMEARRIKPSLEEVFVNITGIKIDEMKNGKEKAGEEK